MYVPEAILLTIDGFQLPVIPLVDKLGKTGGLAPLQIANKKASKIGSILAFMITVEVFCCVDTAPQESVTINEYTPAPVSGMFIKIGFSLDELNPFGPDQT